MTTTARIVVATAMALSLLAAGSCNRGVKPVDVVVSLDQEIVALSRLVLAVDYAASGARPAALHGEPACTTLLPFITMGFSDDGDGTLTLEAFSSTAFSAPLDLAACRMVPARDGLTGEAIASALRITIQEAVNTSGASLAVGKPEGTHAQGGRRNVDGAADAKMRKHKRDRGDSRPNSGRRQAPAAAGSSEPVRPERADATRERVRDGRIDEPLQETLPLQQEPPAAAADSRRPLVLGGGGAAGGSPAGAGPDSGPAAGDGGGGGAGPVPTGGTPAIPYAVTIMVVGQYGDLGALQFDVEYLGPSGNFVGKADSVDCTSLVGAGLAAFTNKENGKVTGAMVNVNGFSTPSLIARCTLKSRDIVTPDSFLVTTTDASDIDTNQLEEFPQMAVVEVVPLN